MDKDLLPPYHFGKQIAFILHLLKGAGGLGHWVTVAMDQAFTSPMLAMVGCWEKFLVVGTARCNRRAWPAEQFAAAEKAGKKIENPGDVCFLHDVGEIANGERKAKYFMTACTWYDKNVVRLLSNRHGGDEEEYLMKHKGQKDKVETKQPEMRKFYNAHKVGVDVIDQRDAAAITGHRARRSPWHRVHDAYANTAMTLAFEHYKVVVRDYGSEQQQKLLHNMSANEARWRLLEQLSKGAKFGTCPPTQAALRLQAAKRARADAEAQWSSSDDGGDDDDDDSDDNDEIGDLGDAGASDSENQVGNTPPPDSPMYSSSMRSSKRRSGSSCSSCTCSNLSRVQSDFSRRLRLCQLERCRVKGLCSREGCPKRGQVYGCMTCGVRLCPTPCFNLHVRGWATKECVQVVEDWVDNTEVIDIASDA